MTTCITRKRRVKIPEKEWYSLPEVARALRITRQYAWRLARAGKIRAEIHGNFRCVHRTELQRVKSIGTRNL